jgi:hypothetical protein
MTDQPQWLSAYAGLDDDALAVLGNRGLVRRAEREVAKVSVATSSADEVVLSFAGPAPVTLRLLPGGPKAARCSCPVAGVCVHLITACLWTRGVSAAAPPQEGAPAVDLLAEVLSWEPAAVNRAAGVAAVRRAMNEPGEVVEVVASGSQLLLSWPGSPQIVVVSGGGFAGMLVAGEHSEVGLNAWKLTAIARLFASHERVWPWPESSEGTALLQVRNQAALAVASAVESLLRTGLSQLRVLDTDQLSAAAQQAKLAKLPLLAGLTGTAAATGSAFANRDDETSEQQLLCDLSQAWALATALTQSDTPAVHLLGAGTTSAAELGGLVPLSANWWLTPAGSRGITVHLWHSATGEVLTATNGRAPGADPSFSRSWTRPLLWGASASTLCAGPFQLADPELRADGTLSPTERTTVNRHGSFAESDFNALAEQVNSFSAGASAVRFGSPAPRLRLIRPRRQHGAAQLELDEVRQQVIWEVIDTASVHHRLEFDVFDTGLNTLGWVIAQQLPISAVVVVGTTPRSVFVSDKGALRLIPLTLDTDRPWQLERRLRKRLDNLREHRSAAPATVADELAGCLTAVAELLSALAATGTGPAMSTWQAESLSQRHQELADLGLQSLAAALAGLSPRPTPQSLLQAQFLLDRTTTLSA